MMVRIHSGRPKKDKHMTFLELPNADGLPSFVKLKKIKSITWNNFSGIGQKGKYYLNFYISSKHHRCATFETEEAREAWLRNFFEKFANKADVFA